MKVLSITEMQLVDGGCQKCYDSGKKAGQYIRNGVFISDAADAISGVWDEVKSWFK